MLSFKSLKQKRNDVDRMKQPNWKWSKSKAIGAQTATKVLYLKTMLKVFGYTRCSKIKPAIPSIKNQSPQSSPSGQIISWKSSLPDEDFSSLVIHSRMRAVSFLRTSPGHPARGVENAKNTLALGQKENPWGPQVLAYFSFTNRVF